MTTLNDTQKTELRSIALKMARELNPNQCVQFNQLGQLNGSIPPTVDLIITHADRIYQWLLNGVDQQKSVENNIAAV